MAAGILTSEQKKKLYQKKVSNYHLCEYIRNEWVRGLSGREIKSAHGRISIHSNWFELLPDVDFENAFEIGRE